MYNKHTRNRDITDASRGPFVGCVLLKLWGKKGSMIFPAQGARAPRYLHTTCLSCASLLLCAVSVWGWLVHDTLLKIDIRSLYKRRLTKKWEGMKAHKGARECDRQRKTKGGERRKVREEERKSFHCTKLEVRGNKHMQVWNGDGKGNEYFRWREWARYPRM